MVSLAEVVEFNPKPTRERLQNDTEVSFVPMSAVEAGTGCMDTSTVRSYAAVKKGYTFFADGDVLFAKITPCMENGKSAVAAKLRNGIGFGSTEFHVLRPGNRIEARFLYHFIAAKRFRNEAAHHMTGAVGQKRVPVDFLRNSNIPLPSLEQQNSIVTEIEKQFSRLDEAVANLQRVKANLRRYWKSVLEDGVRGELAGDTAAWKRTTLGEVALSIRNGCSLKPDAETGARIFRISAVRPLTLNTGDVRYLPGVTSDYATFDLTSGDVLFTRYNGSRDFVGVCALVPDGMLPTVYPDKLIRVRVPVAALLPEFLVISASTDEARAFIETRIRTTAGQAGISGGDLKAVPLHFPSVADQRRIVAEVDRRLSIVRDTEAQVDANLKRAQALRQAVLAKAFSAGGCGR